jgi:hypothetical protein
LLGLQYKVVYKKGKDNQVVDALSRVSCDESISEVTCNAISMVKPKWLEDV